jgi:glutaconate CoA-transferase subunit A
MQPDFRTAPDQIAALIPDGALVAMPPDYSLPSMETVRALVRRRARNLRLLGVPVLGMCADLLIGAGCVAEVESSAVSLGEAGLAPRFSEAVEKGEIVMRDATCPAVHTALQASEKGVPFMPLRGVLGSDLVKNRSDWQVLQNPFSGTEDPILFVSARSSPTSRCSTRAGRTRRATSGSGAGASSPLLPTLRSPAWSLMKRHAPATCWKTSCSRRG